MSGYTTPDGKTVKEGYGLFSKEAQVNRTAFLIHHQGSDLIVVDEKTGIPVRAEYHFHDPNPPKLTNQHKGEK
jgi:uncharacterized protein (DUF952 family)